MKIPRQYAWFLHFCLPWESNQANEQKMLMYVGRERRARDCCESPSLWASCILDLWEILLFRQQHFKQKWKRFLKILTLQAHYLSWPVVLPTLVNCPFFKIFWQLKLFIVQKWNLQTIALLPALKYLKQLLCACGETRCKPLSYIRFLNPPEDFIILRFQEQSSSSCPLFSNPSKHCAGLFFLEDGLTQMAECDYMFYVSNY